MYKLKNNTFSPHVVNTKSGDIVIKPQEEIKADIDDSYAAQLNRWKIVTAEKIRRGNQHANKRSKQ